MNGLTSRNTCGVAEWFLGESIWYSNENNRKWSAELLEQSNIGLYNNVLIYEAANHPKGLVHHIIYHPRKKDIINKCDVHARTGR